MRAAPSPWIGLPGIHGEPVPGITLLQLPERALSNRTSRIRRSIQGGVMYDDQLPIPRQAEIQFYGVRSKGDALKQCRNRVLRSVRAIAAVSDDGSCCGITQNHAAT